MAALATADLQGARDRAGAHLRAHLDGLQGEWRDRYLKAASPRPKAKSPARAPKGKRRIAAETAHARRIVCIGYTDDLGPRRSNLALGLERARAVCAKLRALGVHAVLKAESRGEARPCASNATARGRARNRRVELRITY